jgi:hypothetical protein
MAEDRGEAVFPNFVLKLSEKSRRGVRRGLQGHGSGAIRPVLARHTDQISARSSARTPFQTVSTRSSVRVASHRSYRARPPVEEDPTAACSHTNFPKEYAATSDADRNDTAQPHARRRIPTFALSVATSTLTKAHNSAPRNNATHGSSTGVGGGIGPVLPMFLAASAKQTGDVPTTHAHHTLTELSSLSVSPPRTSYTYRSTSHGKTAAMRTSENTPSETV